MVYPIMILLLCINYFINGYYKYKQKRKIAVYDTAMVYLAETYNQKNCILCFSCY